MIFTKAIEQIQRGNHSIATNYVLDEMMPGDQENPVVFVEDRERSWKSFMDDLLKAKTRIHIDIPDVIDGNDQAIGELIDVLCSKKEEKLDICIRIPEDVDLPKGLQAYAKQHPYVTTPVTLIDRKIVWFGHPLYAADFISEGDILDTECFPCIRFQGVHATRSVQAFLEM